MKIVVIGGIGLIGSMLVRKLRQQDHEVLAASPESGVNTLTLVEGLAPALAGAQVVVDLENSPSFLESVARVAYSFSDGKALPVPTAPVQSVSSDDVVAALADRVLKQSVTPTVFYRTLNVEGLEIFYREAGPRESPTVLLLHGFPSSSHMFRNLIPILADKYHVVAPDFPGYGESSAPSVDDFDYSFERLASVTEEFTEKLNLSSYALYLSDIGASVGFRLAVMHPERVTAMIIQNGVAHVEAINKEFLTGNKEFSTGLADYWEERSEKNAQVLLDWLLTIEGTKWHYLHGAKDPSKISPDNWVIDQAYQDRPGNKDIQLSVLYNAKRDLDVFDDWQKYFRKHLPPTLITWGKNDGIFTVEGAELLKRDIPGAELYLLDTGHFALEEEVDRIGSLIHEFLDRTINWE
jgi:pimeloyl-ACP methyl ester carboxylesterase